MTVAPPSPTLTAKGRGTRERIIEGASQECRCRGAHLITLNHIIERTHTSKSQLFHYFPNGKAQLFLEVAAYEEQRVLDDQQPHLSNLRSWAAWQRWRDAVTQSHRRQGSLSAMAALITEVGPKTSGPQAISAERFRRWRVLIVAGIQAMQGAGKNSTSVDAEQAAAALLAGIQGGVGILMATGDPSYLESALDEGIVSLRRRP